MTNSVQSVTATFRQSIREKKSVRWTVLFLIAITMASGYFFNDILAPLEEILIRHLKWDGEQYGFFSGQYAFLNIIGFIVLGGILLDKLGIRFTGTVFISLMIVGGLIKAYGVSDYFNNGGWGYDFFSSFATAYLPSVKVATIGYALFGLGIEIAGITANRVIVKWFKGKELAFAMGLQVAIARLGMGCAFLFSPLLSQGASAYRPIITGVLILCIGLLSFLLHCIADTKLDQQEKQNTNEKKEVFHLSDIGKLFQNYGFATLTLLCVLFYSCVFPFMKFVSNLFINKYGVDAQTAGNISFVLPLATICLTPVFGSIMDRKGKAASMMIIGPFLLLIAHSIFAFLPGQLGFAYVAMFILGVAFSLVPSAMWPSVPKIVADKELGTAFSLVFWIQNIGLWCVPMFIGKIREWTNPGITAQKQQGIDVAYDYTYAILLLVGFAVAALITAFLLKYFDKKYDYGLEKANLES